VEGLVDGEEAVDVAVIHLILAVVVGGGGRGKNIREKGEGERKGVEDFEKEEGKGGGERTYDATKISDQTPSTPTD
jgi:hypothetical protein